MTAANDQAQRKLLNFLTVEQMVTFSVMLVMVTFSYANLQSQIERQEEAQRRTEVQMEAVVVRQQATERAINDRLLWEARMEATSLRIEAKVDGLSDKVKDQQKP
jgi:Tfp pilus assembly protein FimT